jgi:DNA invertase Pin-like site-specific DNA recombinase
MAIADFTGRTAELHSLLERLSGAGMAVTVVSGMLGVGKTTPEVCHTIWMTTTALIYLRLSDFRDEDADAFDAREARLRAEAARLGWHVGRVVVENDWMPGNGNGRARPASAFKRRKIRTPSGRTELRTIRPGFRSMLDDLMAGRASAVLAEDLDRACRDPRDLEDFIDVMRERRADARSLSGSLTFTRGGTDSEITMARVMVTMANKSSLDTSRRVASGRQARAADGSYGGGRRPFGYRPDPESVKHRRTLLVIPEEAAEITRAAEAVLASAGTVATDGPLKSLARSLRERAVPTVTGTAWSALTLRDILLKPTVAGLAPHTDPDTGQVTLNKALWQPILERDTWEAVRAVLTDPARRTTTSNAPKWLGTGIYRCGICDDGTSVHVTGGRDHSPAYVCKKRSHLRRQAEMTDAWVAMHIIERLSRDDAADLLAPPARPGVDAHALRAEARNLTEIGKRQARMHALGDMPDDEYMEGSRARKARLARIRADLAAATAPDPLAEFRGQPGAEKVWDSLPLPRKRAVLKLVASVTLLPAARRGKGFDPESVRIGPVRP